MSYDICLASLRLHPTIPHHLMHVEGIFWKTHGIHDSAGTIVGLTAMMGVGVGEDNLHPAAADTCTGAGTLTVVVVPSPNHLNGKMVHVVIIVGSGITTVERAVTFLMEWIAVFIPVFAQSLVAAILHRPHGMFLRLIDIQHLAAVFRLVDIQHLTAADGPTAIGVVLVAYLLHLQHVLS